MKVVERQDVEKIDIKVYSDKQLKPLNEAIAVERPLEIRLSQNGLSSIQLAITMRTPGEDFDLAKGFLFSEGIISNDTDIQKDSFTGDDIIDITLSNSIDYKITEIKRRLYVSSSCGVCGQQSLSDLAYHSSRLPWASKFTITPQLILTLADLMSAQQLNFKETGGLHAAALFNNEGKLISIREDVGRHNALDKLIGANFHLGNDQTIILVSGRLSYELVQKTAMFGTSILISIGPPSSLAIDIADKEGITLVGFLKSDSFNIYTHPQRIKTNR